MSMTVLRPGTFQTILTRRRTLAPTVEEFVFALPDGATMPARAGQFVTVEAPAVAGALPAKRPYSLVHAPLYGAALQEVTLCVKILDGGAVSGFLDGLKHGDAVTITGAFGHFGLQPHFGPRVFVATGTGIAPFVGMLEELTATPKPSTITLITGDRTEEEILYEDELQQLGAAIRALGGSFTLLRCVSRPSDAWAGVRGRVTDVLATHITDPATTQVTLCGNPQMIEDASALCATLGVPPELVVKEKFTSIGKAQAKKAAASDAA